MSFPSKSHELVFLKLGGSLITDKNSARTARKEVLDRLAEELAQVFREHPGFQLLLGHGSGSFGHIPAKAYNTRMGVSNAREWEGFAEVWKEAAALNHLVIDALAAAGMPAIALPASAGLISTDGQVDTWDIEPIRLSLQAGLLPVIYGDVVFDRRRGGTIFSTEDLFVYLAPRLKPSAIFLAGIEPGVWADFPTCKQLVRRITPNSVQTILEGLRESAGIDVTGGMASKVREMVSLVERLPDLKVEIFSGMQTGNIQRVLCGKEAGTRITAG